jgi:glycosyltransferase involved in cell wall biosynthesis
VHAQKGVEDLLAAFIGLPGGLRCRLTVAGECHDPALQRRLEEAASVLPGQITLRLRRVPEEEVADLLASADAVALPFQRVTTSGSAILALCHGRPVIVPDLVSLRHLPQSATIWYDGSVASLRTALIDVAKADGETLAAMSAAAREYTDSCSWAEAAQRLMAEIRRLTENHGQ